jgi:hypothetical protein
MLVRLNDGESAEISVDTTEVKGDRSGEQVAKVDTRAEEWHVSITGDGVQSITHSLPDAVPGTNMTAERARQIAVAHLLAISNITVVSSIGADDDDADRVVGGCSTVVEVSAMPQQLSGRVDWSFEFSCTTNSADGAVRDGGAFPFGLMQGDARVAIGVADAGEGEHVTFYTQYVKIPEKWSREEQNTGTLDQLASTVCILFVKLCFLIAAGGAIVAWSKTPHAPTALSTAPSAADVQQSLPQFSSATFWTCFRLLLVVHVVGIINQWPVLTYSLSTASPTTNQIVSLLSGSAVSACVNEGAVALALAFALSRTCVTRQATVEDGGSEQGNGERSNAATNIIQLTLFAAGVLLALRGMLRAATPSDAIQQPISAAVTAATLLNVQSGVAALVISSVKTVVTRGTAGILYFGLLDTLVEASSGVPPSSSAAASSEAKTGTGAWTVVADGMQRVGGSIRAMMLLVLGGVVTSVMMPVAHTTSSVVGVVPLPAVLVNVRNLFLR